MPRSDSDKQIDENKKVRIRIVHGDQSKVDLENCYFYPIEVPGVYTFYGQQNEVLATYVTSGMAFRFWLKDLGWTIGTPGDATSFEVDDEHAHGNWTNNAPKIAQDESGTFQAQAGGGAGEEENASAATAY